MALQAEEEQYQQFKKYFHDCLHNDKQKILLKDIDLVSINC